jgi:hypothetical protein
VGLRQLPRLTVHADHLTDGRNYMKAEKSIKHLKKGKKLEPTKALSKVPISDIHVAKFTDIAST